MEDSDTTYGFKEDIIVALLSANVKVLLYNVAITTVGIP